MIGPGGAAGAAAAAGDCPQGPPRGSTRDRAMQAVDYYNNTVLRARVNAGLATPRSGPAGASYRGGGGAGGGGGGRASAGSAGGGGGGGGSPGGGHIHSSHQEPLYRSNSSLELVEHGPAQEVLRREYGSHGSIDVIGAGSAGVGGGQAASAGDSFFAMLQDYRPAVLGLLGADQRSPGPAEYLRGKLEPAPASENAANALTAGTEDGSGVMSTPSGPPPSSTSPKLRLKLHRFWGGGSGSGGGGSGSGASGSASGGTGGGSGGGSGAGGGASGGGGGGGAGSACAGGSGGGSGNGGGAGGGGNSSVSSSGMGSSSGKPPRAGDERDGAGPSSGGGGGGGAAGLMACAPSTAAEVEERQRRRAFAHYDCQSLTANLGYAAKLRGLLLARRRNTTTGASAASMLSAGRSATPDGGDSGDEDPGDGRGNDLLESCPFFRNEIGGEEERIVSLTRMNNGAAGAVPPGSSSNASDIALGNHGHGRPLLTNQHRQRRPQHRPSLAYGVSVLEFPVGDTHWRHGTCPYQRPARAIESVDQGALYYRKYFHGQDHQNWFGMDENLGPVAISIKKERIDRNDGNASSSSSSNSGQIAQYRLIIRTSELLTLRGSILEDAVPNLKASNSNKGMNTKEVLEYIAPELQISCLRLGIHSAQTEEQLLKLDEQGLTNHYKVGVLYCRAGQASEEDMYNNEDAGPAFREFLDSIGQRVRLKGFDKYKAGLDNKTDSTGLYSVYAQYQDCEIMFHVSTMLPFTPNNRQQLLRKRHIGNDIVTIVFQEPGAQPFTPKNIRSQFQHVFIVVRAINPCSENTQYSVAVSRSKEVPIFGPPIHDGAMFPKSKAFADFLLAKVINAENAAHRSEKFATMATRTRQEYLKDLATNYTTSAIVETGQKFSIMSFSSKKKERGRPRMLPDASQRGAISWQVLLDDSSQACLVECFLGISADSFVLIEERTREIVFVTPCKSILGWCAQTNSLRIYHHQGECVTMHMREAGERDELMEVVVRLRAVTEGCASQELSLRRNPMGQLGFHVQPDGMVTQVEGMGLAWQAGLRQGARLVEICKIAVSTLSHDQMVDLLKTSLMVTVMVIPPHVDGTPRRGCNLQNCKYTTGNYEGDYENLSSPEESSCKLSGKLPAFQQAVPGNHRRYDEYGRNFSPPRSSSSSGYGTGSSSKSFTGTDTRFSSNPEGTMTSSSSGHSSDDRWYELLDPADLDPAVRDSGVRDPAVRDSPPPPLPARLGSGGSSAFQQVAPKRRGGGVPGAMEEPVSGLNPVHTSLHPKVQVSHSLPLPHASFSLPLTSRYAEEYEALGNSQYSHDFKLGDKVSHLKTPNGNSDARPGPRHSERQPALDYLSARIPKITDYNNHQHSGELGKSSSLPPECAVRGLTLSDGHSTDTSSASDRMVGAPSEDELSAGSSNVSPRLCRSSKPTTLGPSSGTGAGTLTPSSGSSRNQSPRPASRDMGEARLRPGVTPRSASNRNSANLASSTLQEDLMRLINPDYMSEREESAIINTKENHSSNIMGKVYSSCTNNSNANGLATSENCLRSRSRENLCTTNGSTLMSLGVLSSTHSDQHTNNVGNVSANERGDVILTMARPATVISNASTASSPAPSENKMSKEERLSPRVTKSSPNSKLSPNTAGTSRHELSRHETLQIPDSRETDWPGLMDSAARSLMQSQSGDPSPVNPGSTLPENARNGDAALGHWVDEMAEHLGLDNNPSGSRRTAELHNHQTELQARLARETRRRLSLEEEVRRLRDENRRLQEESQAAAQQLRRFTEWFFQTIDRQ
ncbi:hypothetical protein R5R35_002024 [Gryllus longicercus]|uniref:Signal-induced proliferation-associated 1-like protein 2 n=2 Tax=Gryllus longicercus TaxID=2509291 RepID=A0AAN9YZJ7_9ORTH